MSCLWKQIHRYLDWVIYIAWIKKFRLQNNKAQAVAAEGHGIRRFWRSLISIEAFVTLHGETKHTTNVDQRWVAVDTPAYPKAANSLD